MTTTDLEQAALHAHARGETFGQFYWHHAAHMRAAEGRDVQRWRQLFGRLFELVNIGEVNGVRFILTLQPVPDKTDPKGIRRLRRLLKLALRVCRLRCVNVVATDGAEETTNPVQTVSSDD